MGRVGERVPVDVVGPVGGVGADDVEGRAAAVGPDRQHAGRGLDVVAADEQRGVDPVALEQADEHLADRVGADRAGAAHLGAELRQRQRGAAGRARGGDPDLLDQLAALALGDLLDRAHEHVEHVHAHRHRAHLRPHPASPAGFVVP